MCLLRIRKTGEQRSRQRHAMMDILPLRIIDGPEILRDRLSNGYVTVNQDFKEILCASIQKFNLLLSADYHNVPHTSLSHFKLDEKCTSRGSSYVVVCEMVMNMRHFFEMSHKTGNRVTVGTTWKKNLNKDEQ